MRHFGKHLSICIGWLLISELLCLILAFSFAILRAEWIRWLSLVCGIAAHVLLMGSCAGKCAHEDIAAYRADGTIISVMKPLLLGLCTTAPLWMLWGFLKMQGEQ